MTFQPGKRVMLEGANDSIYGTLVENVNGTMGIQLDELKFPVGIEEHHLVQLKPLLEDLQPAAELV